jgi:serine/threonine protein kinase
MQRCLLFASEEQMADRDLCGRTLGEFVLLELLGSGGFGDVYRASQPGLDRDVVVKVLHEQEGRNAGARQRFQREAQLASRLDHHYAAHVHAFGVEDEDGLLWIAMEHVRGITVDKWLIEHGPMPLGQLVPFFERLADVVDCAHDLEIVHRDLKAANVMVIERGGKLIPKLLDLGIAKASEELAPRRPEPRPSAESPELVAAGGANEPVTRSARLTRPGERLGSELQRRFGTDPPRGALVIQRDAAAVAGAALY